MRCGDVIRELAAPSVGLDSVALSAHLAQCPECAAWAERDAKLNRLWEVTSPAAPSADAWDQVWARASESLDRQPDVDVLPMPASAPQFGRRAIWIFGIAQAAAAAVILILVLGPANQGSLQNTLTAKNQPAPVPIEIAQAPSSAIDEVEIDQGEFSVIQFNAAGKRIAQTDLALQSTAMVESLELFNYLEGNAGEGNVVQ